MVRHWTRHAAHRDATRGARAGCSASRVINAVGAGDDRRSCSSSCWSRSSPLGAWIAIVAMVVLFVLMRGIRRHYDQVARRARGRRGRRPPRAARRGPRDRAGLQGAQADAAGARVRAGHAARTTLEAVTVDVDPDETRGAAARVGPPRHPGAAQGARLAVPRDHPAGPRLRRAASGGSPRDLVTVYIPEYVVGHWWEQLLHNQSALRLKGRLLFTPGVMVTSVPWQLQSSEGAERDRIDEPPSPGAVARRGP